MTDGMIDAFVDKIVVHRTIRLAPRQTAGTRYMERTNDRAVQSVSRQPCFDKRKPYAFLGQISGDDGPGAR